MSNDWKKDIGKLAYSPHAIQRYALEQLESAHRGELEIADPSNPFVFLLEASALNAAACMEHAETATRQQYPAMAMTEEELYLHMSDADYIGRFATPARATFQFIFDREELIARAVATSVDGIRKLTIPRHTQVRFGDIKFTMQYPVDVRVMRHGGLQVTYDTSKPSPLKRLTTNRVNWGIRNLNGKERVVIDIPMEQMEIRSHTLKMTATTAPARRFTLEGQFYHARVYTSIGGEWVELQTTHTEQVLDPTIATAQLKVYQDTLEVRIPNIYYINNLMGSEVRIDIYTTEGEYSLSMDGYNSDAFTATWKDYDQTPNDSKYIAPLSVFSDFWVLSSETLVGGTNGIGFVKLRKRVIENALGSANVPITNAQITSRLEERGYSTVVNIDNITNREFLATRLLPRPVNHDVVSGAGCTIRSILSSMDAFAEHANVKDNGDRITLLPDMLYKDVNGVVSPVSNIDVQKLLALPVDIRARKASEEKYLYSPFHYVIERSNDRFDLRAYYLDNPEVVPREFVAENDTTGVSVSTEIIEIEKNVDTGHYEVFIQTKSTDAFKDIPVAHTHVQLGFIPRGELDYAYLNAEFLKETDNGERVYKAIITTNYDIDDQNYLGLTGFRMYNDSPKRHWCQLDQEFALFYAVSEGYNTNVEPSTVDTRLGLNWLPVGTVGVTEEKIGIVFGKALEGLWSASRTVASPEDYRVYDSDVPAVYEKTVYARDPVSQAMIVNVVGNKLQYQILHNAGDPVLDQNGQPTIRHRKGEIVLDSHGNPEIVGSRRLKRQVDLFLVDGVYWFATEATAVRYQAEIPKIITNWLEQDIVPVSQYLLEETNLYYYPKSTLGHAEVIVRENEKVTIALEQAFYVTYYMKSDKYRDIPLRRALSTKTVETINEILQESNVKINDIYKRLTEMVSDDVVALDVKGLGGRNEFSSVMLNDDAARLSIRKKNVALEDGTIGVQDDVQISFVNHLE